MRSIRLRCFVFLALFVPALFVIRFLLATRLGIVGAAMAFLIGFLFLLYRSIKTMALAFWEVSGALAEAVESVYDRRNSGKESGHAARLL